MSRPVFIVLWTLRRLLAAAWLVRRKNRAASWPRAAASACLSHGVLDAKAPGKGWLTYPRGEKKYLKSAVRSLLVGTKWAGTSETTVRAKTGYLVY